MVALDTYEIVKELRAVGFDEAQAAALTAAVKRAQQIDLSSFVTEPVLRAALADLRAELKSDLAAEIKAVHSDVTAIQKDFTNKLLAVAGVQFVALVGAIAALFRLLQPAAG